MDCRFGTTGTGCFFFFPEHFFSVPYLKKNYFFVYGLWLFYNIPERGKFDLLKKYAKESEKLKMRDRRIEN